MHNEIELQLWKAGSLDIVVQSFIDIQSRIVPNVFNVNFSIPLFFNVSTMKKTWISGWHIVITPNCHTVRLDSFEPISQKNQKVKKVTYNWDTPLFSANSDSQAHGQSFMYDAYNALVCKCTDYYNESVMSWWWSRPAHPGTKPIHLYFSTRFLHAQLLSRLFALHQ